MKLNYKRTLFVGFAFFLICLFWQAYDNIIPLILTNKFGMSQMWSGVIMALDNVFALFLLPFFGALSDRSASKRGKRTPFIVIGTLVAAVLFVGISVVDGMQRTKLADVTPDKYESSLALIYDSDPVISDPGVEKTDGMSFGEALKDVFSSGTRKNLSELISREEFLAIEMYGEDGKTASVKYAIRPCDVTVTWLCGLYRIGIRLQPYRCEEPHRVFLLHNDFGSINCGRV